MGWREKLFGDGSVRRSGPKIEDEVSRTTKDIGSVLRGGPTTPPRTCAEGHPVREGQDTCIDGHYVGD